MSAQEKIHSDAAVMAAMLDDLISYLASDVLFWPLPYSDMPRLTLGGYLMRQHRLDNRRSRLSGDQIRQLDLAMARFQEIIRERIVATETKAHKELGARLRQMENEIADLRRGGALGRVAETRTMISALLEFLGQRPFQLDEQLPSRVAGLDAALRGRWRKGEFIWLEDWETAYPADKYWWLYASSE